MPAARLDVIGIVVANMARSLAFYRHLGLDLPAAADAEDHVELQLDGGLRVAWDTVEVVRSYDPGWTPSTGGHRIALSFVCPDPENVDRTYAELSEAGYDGHLPPWDAPWGQRYAVLHDPDGNVIDLFAPLPG